MGGKASDLGDCAESRGCDFAATKAAQAKSGQKSDSYTGKRPALDNPEWRELIGSFTEAPFRLVEIHLGIDQFFCLGFFGFVRFGMHLLALHISMIAKNAFITAMISKAAQFGRERQSSS